MKFQLYLETTSCRKKWLWRENKVNSSEMVFVPVTHKVEPQESAARMKCSTLGRWMANYLREIFTQLNLGVMQAVQGGRHFAGIQLSRSPPPPSPQKLFEEVSEPLFFLRVRWWNDALVHLWATQIWLLKFRRTNHNRPKSPIHLAQDQLVTL